MSPAAASGPFLLDTITWLRLFQCPQELSARARQVLSAQRQLFLSWISLWEIRALVEKKKVNLPVPIAEWLHLATPAKVCLVDLSSDIAAHQLPGDFSARQTNRIIVATARCRQMTVVTAEEEILNYPHVQSLDPR